MSQRERFHAAIDNEVSAVTTAVSIEMRRATVWEP